MSPKIHPFTQSTSSTGLITNYSNQGDATFMGRRYSFESSGVTPSSTVQTVRVSSPENELTVACAANRLDLVKAAIGNNVPPQKLTLLKAVQSQNIHILKAVIDTHAKPHGDRGQLNELTAACHTKNLDIVRELSTRVNDLRLDGTTLIAAIASENGYIEKIVVDLGGKPGPNTLSAILKGLDFSLGCVERVIELGAVPDSETLDLLLQKTSSTELIRWALQKGAPISARTITCACQYKCNIELFVLELLKAGAKPDNETFKSIGNAVGWDKIHLFNPNIMDALFAAGLKPTHEDIGMMSPVHNTLKRKFNGNCLCICCVPMWIPGRYGRKESICVSAYNSHEEYDKYDKFLRRAEAAMNTSASLVMQ